MKIVRTIHPWVRSLLRRPLVGSATPSSAPHRWAAFALIVAFGCGHAEEHEHEVPHFEVTTPLRQDTEVTREYVAQIRAHQHIEIRALEEGYLERVDFDEGQHVDEGQSLFQIVPTVYRAEYARSRAEARAADIELANIQQLRDGNVVSANRLALAQAQRDRAAAERQVAQAHLNFAHIRAPFDGIVGRLEVRRGSLLEEGELMTVLSDNSEMWVYFNVSEPEYLAYRLQHREGDDATPVQLRMANGELFDQPGVIQTIESDFNNETGTIAFRAGFPNPELLLRHGETGSIIMSTTIPDALVIPQSATFEVLEKRFVFVVDDEDIVRAREIEVAQDLRHIFVVGSGLEPSDRILIEGLRRVHDGEHIEPTERDAAEVIAGLDLPAE